MARPALVATLLAALVAAPATAQDPPLLVVTASAGDVVRELAAIFDPSLRTGDLALDQLVVHADGRAAMRRADPAIRAEHERRGTLIELQARPGDWLRAAHADIEPLARTARQRLDVIAAVTGLRRGAGGLVVDAALDVLGQVETASLILRRAGDTRQVVARLTPAAGSPLAAWLRLVRPAPMRPVPAVQDAALALQAGVDPKALPDLLLPLLDWSGHLLPRAGGEPFDWPRLIAALDGSASFALGSGRSVLALGLADAGAYERLVTADAALQDSARRLRAQGVDADFEARAWQHRGASALRSTVVGRMPTGLENAHGEVIGYATAVRDLWLAVAGGDDTEDFMKSTLDGVLDANLLRRFPDVASRGQVLTLEIHPGRLFRSFVPAAEAPPSSALFDVPYRLHVSLYPTGQSLEALIQLR